MDFKLAVVQLSVGFNKDTNLHNAMRGIEKGVKAGASVILLPEMFNCPYSNDYFPEYAEELPGSMTYEFLAEQALKHQITLVGGSIPEREGEKIFNTSFIFGPKGNLLGRHRKLHLFDIDVSGGIRFKESDTLSAGKEITVLDTEVGRLGVAICYDVRFPELFRLMSLQGARLILVPAAFNMTTGPLHWELLFRARAVDNQVFIAAASPSRDDNGIYTAWGHSLVVDPWGKIIKEAGIQDEVIVADIEMSRLEGVREQIPVLKHLRRDLYETVFHKNEKRR